jgi:hypothetical protein
MKSGDYLLEPLKAVWGIEFGSDETALTSQNKLVRLKDEENESVGWRTYGIEESLRVYCVEGKVVSIAVYSTLIYKGKNLIGVDVKDLNSVLGPVKIESEGMVDLTNGVQEVLDIDDLGLQVWTRKNRVVSVTCDDGN